MDGVCLAAAFVKLVEEGGDSRMGELGCMHCMPFVVAEWLVIAAMPFKTRSCASSAINENVWQRDQVVGSEVFCDEQLRTACLYRVYCRSVRVCNCMTATLEAGDELAQQPISSSVL
jgi:hypothetical protein